MAEALDKLERQVAPQHRTAFSDVRTLIMHTQGKLDWLPELAEMHGLALEIVEELKKHLQSEIEALNQLPPDAPLAHLMPEHLEQARQFRERFLENSPYHQERLRQGIP